MGSVNSADNFTWLEHWYSSQCNGDWEHNYGVTIESIDNPGWRVKIDLNGTRYAALPNFDIKENYDSDSEWMVCKIVEGVYEGVAGPFMLGPIIQTFRSWIENF
jgi:hypothetical protein